MERLAQLHRSHIPKLYTLTIIKKALIKSAFFMSSDF